MFVEGPESVTTMAAVLFTGRHELTWFRNETSVHVSRRRQWGSTDSP